MQSMMSAPYLGELHAVLPRLLALYDTDPLSLTFGLGDRSYWAWKTTDFANATYQGAAHGLARLVHHNLLPEGIGERAIVERIVSMIEALPRITGRDGGLAEAYPNESSFCVTALALFDGMLALDLLGGRLPQAARNHWLEILTPLARFLHKADETHGFIANHLATAAAALYRWQQVTGGGERQGRVFLDRILKAQSDEGWFPEYGGTDPGYQTLSLYYLADLRQLRPDLELDVPLARCIDFLSYFAHPDGSFGGFYGWRGTRFCVPSGFEVMAPDNATAAAFAVFVRNSLAARRLIPLAAFDEPNLPVMFNAWAWAAALAVAHDTSVSNIPCAGTDIWRRHFPEAGLVVDKGERHYSIVSWKKGGVVQHYVDGNCVVIDPGVVIESSTKVLATTQSLLGATFEHDSEGTLIVTAPFVVIRSRPPVPAEFVLLRLLSLTVLRVRAINEWFKRLLVRRLVTGGRKTGLRNCRRIRLGVPLHIEDEIVGASTRWRRVTVLRPFNPIHMASRGYWQIQDDGDA